MTETWLPWAIRAPAPPEKSGYFAIPSRGLQHILYMVPHSAEGWEAYLRQGHRPGANASWPFSNCQDGDFYQHYPLEAITWTSGTTEANISGLAVENEGVAGQPLNAKQVANLRRLREDLSRLCVNLRPPVLGQGFREHHELSGGATTCPSGRIQPLYDSYQEQDDDLTPEEKAEMFRLLGAMVYYLELINARTENSLPHIENTNNVAQRLQAAFK